MKQSLDYINLKIDGMHYVREIKKGDNIAYLLIDNKNKPVKNVYFYETLLKHIPNKVRYKRIYTVTPILKRTGQIVNRERIRPIEIHKIFEPKKLNYFFKILNKDFNPVYQFLFYLLSVTGLRVSEALALKITDYTYRGLDIEFDNKNWDISLDSSTENQWHIKIVVRNDNPSDLKVKFNKPRNFVISDQSYEFRNLFKNYLIYRNLCLKKHNNKTDFLFVNRTVSVKHIIT